MVRIPRATPSNIGDTKLKAQGLVNAGPTADAAPDLLRRKDANWRAPAGPGGDAPPPPPEPKAGVTATDPDDPPAGAIWWDLPDDLRRTIQRSFRDRVSGTNGAGNALGGVLAGAPGKHLWKCFDDDLPDVLLSVLSLIHERIVGIDRKLWTLVKWIGGIWAMAESPPSPPHKHHGCIGFGVTWQDRKGAEKVLMEYARDPKVALGRDETWGAAEHQGGFVLPNLFSDADCHTFRELHVLDKPGLHFCVATSEEKSKHDDIHIDWACPADGKETSGSHRGRCTYAADVSVAHILQALANVGVPTAWFSFGNYQKRMDEIRKKIAGWQPIPDPDGGGIIDPPREKYVKRCDEIEKTMGLASFYQPDFGTWKTRQAMRGQSGVDAIQKVVEKFDKPIQQLEDEVNSFK